jgi:hypothetical protein
MASFDMSRPLPGKTEKLHEKPVMVLCGTRLVQRKEKFGAHFSNDVI